MALFMKEKLCKSYSYLLEHSKHFFIILRGAYHRLLYILLIVISSCCVVVTVHNLYADVALRQACALFAWVRK